MGRIRIALAALALAVPAAVAADGLSVALALPQCQDAPALAPAPDDAPRPLSFAPDSALPVVLRNESGRPLRIAAGIPRVSEMGVSFRLVLDDQRVVRIRWRRPAAIDAAALEAPGRYWLLRPGEPLVLAVRLGNGQWGWDPAAYAGHRGVLVPVFEEGTEPGSPPLLWSGHAEGKGVPVQL